MSKLSIYLKDSGVSQRAFAKKVGCDPSIVSRLISTGLVPSLALAARIQRETCGVIQATSWVEEKDGDALPPSQGVENHTPEIEGYSRGGSLTP